METGRPIPKPRRTILEANKLKYENVTIDLKNKELRIECDNNNKNVDDTVDNVSSKSLNREELLNANVQSISQIDETDFKHEIKIQQQNENTQSEEKQKGNPVALPVPAPRLPKKINQKGAYENVKSADSNDGKLDNEKCIMYRSLDIPKYTKNDSYDTQRSQSPISACSSTENGGDSNSTIDSSRSSVSSSDNPKYKNPSPSQLLKNLGTTSKLLTEAITERVTIKAKNAKHKLNENIKISQDFLHSFSTDTASRIKSVRKKLHTSMKSDDSSRSRYENTLKCQQQQQEAVLNDQVFNTISFQSPLDKKSYSSRSSYPDTYEIPNATAKKLNYVSDDEDACPTFEEAMRNRSYSLKNFDTKSRNCSYKVKNENDLENEDNNRKSICSLPMPTYPAPVLEQPEQQNEEKHKSPIYGKIKEIEPPIRLKRKSRNKIQEAREISNDNLSTISSNRATIDSIEFSSLPPGMSKEVNNVEIRNKETESSSSNISSKSQSWIYHDKDEDEVVSSPEPIYTNQEITYDRLCEMGTNDSEIILSPKPDFENKNNDSSTTTTRRSLSSNENDIIYEFDPLRKKNVLDYYLNKSNELLLLEHLLLDDNYGTVIENDSQLPDENLNAISSEDDNDSVSGATALPPPTPTRIDSLQKQRSLNEIEPIIQTYLSKTDDTNLIDSVTESKTNWFVDCDNIQKSSSIYNPINKNDQQISKKVTKTINLPKLKIPEGPPSYAEAIAQDNGSNNTINSISNNIDNTAKSQQNPFEQSKPKVKSVLSNVMIKMEDALKRKTSFRSNQSKGVKVVLQMIPRPTISSNLVRYEGPLIRFPSGVVEDILNDMQNRKAILRDKKFQTYQDHSMKNLKESIHLENITTIQCVSNNKITDNFTHLYCFEITIATQKNQMSSSSSSSQILSNPNVLVTNKDSCNCKLQRICHLYGVGKESERDIWMQKLLESLTTVFPSNYTCQYYRAGWCYLKRSITSPWSGSWILLNKRKRKFFFYSEHEMNLEKVDLRKARCIVLKENDSTIKNLYVETGPILMLDCPPFTLYLIMNFSRETKIWKHIICEIAHNNGPTLFEQQLTKNNVPVIIDKCINFIYIYGSMSEGIYRKSGLENSIQKLIELFRMNAFNVEITKSEYNEHDVANVLKRFMRDLPQKLLNKYSESFCSVVKIKKKSEKISAYKELLNRLNIIEYQTLKKLIGHLSFIASLSSKNKMNIENLAVIWGPTIIQNKEEQMSYSQKEADVMSDLIILFKDLFVLSADEMKKEQEMLACLQKYYASGESLLNSIKQSGDLKVWVTYNKEEKTQTNVTLTPTKTAHEICKELSNKINIPSYKLTLFEVILNENLERPLHYNEKVFDVVLKWSYWNDTDRKNNYLVVKKYDLLKEIDRVLKHLPIVTPSKELKFADNKTKSLKLFNCELRDTIILIQKKDKNSVTIVKEISLQNTTVYLGCEKKREIPSHNWSITFIQQDGNSSRSKETPFIGHIITGSEWKDRIIWYSSIWHCLYGDNILPQAEFVIK